MAEKQIGKVMHFYDHIPAAVVKLTDTLSVGDKIRFVHEEHTAEQTVESMEIDHEKCETAKAGDEVAIKTAGKVHDHSEVYKLR